jgi:hypothetical protein
MYDLATLKGRLLDLREQHSQAEGLRRRQTMECLRLVDKQIKMWEQMKGIKYENAQRNQENLMENEGYDFGGIDYPDPDNASG